MFFSSHPEEKRDSVKKFESMLKTNDIYFFDIQEFQEIIMYYMDTGKMSLAKKVITIGLEQHPSSTELKLLHTEVLIFENRFDKAKELLDDSSYIGTGSEDMYIQKATIYSRKKEHSKAIAILKEALTITEESHNYIHSLIAMEYLYAEEYEMAKNYFIKCLYGTPDNLSFLFNIVHCYNCLEDIDGAIEFLNSYLNKEPYSALGWHQLGKQFCIKKMYEEAISSFNFSIYSDDTFIGAYIEKANILKKIKRFDEAIDSYQTAFQLDLTNYYACLKLGKCYEKMGDLEAAKKYYLLIIKEDPLSEKGWLAMFNLYWKRENYTEALHYINKAIGIDSENIIYWRKYIDINKLLNCDQEVYLACKKIMELGNYNFKTWREYGDILYKLGDYQGALRAFLEGLSMYPKKCELQYRVAGIYYLLSNTSKGNLHLNEALQNNYKKHHLFKKLFPAIIDTPAVKNIMANYKNTSL